MNALSRNPLTAIGLYIVALVAVIIAIPSFGAACGTACVARLFTALTVVYLGVVFLYRRQSWHSTAGLWVLTIASLIVATGILLNIYYFTTYTGGSLDAPTLNNNDARHAWLNALFRLGEDGGVQGAPSQHAYGMIIAAEMWLFGVSVAVPLVVNMACILLTILLSGSIGVNVLRQHLPHRSSAWIATCTMATTAAVCYFLHQGMIGIKDASVSLAMAMMIRSLLSFDNTQRSMQPAFLMVVGTMLMALLRVNYILVFILCILLMWTLICRKRMFANGWQLTFLIASLVWCMMCFRFSAYINHPSDAFAIIQSQPETQILYDAPNQQAWFNIIGDYTLLPSWQKILLLPASCIVQFLIPFPWDFSRDAIFGFSYIYARIAYPWYFIGGIILYWIGMVVCRFCQSIKSTSLGNACRQLMSADTSSAKLYAVVITGIICWVIPAYLFGGTISRYTLCTIPMLAPAVVMVLGKYARNRSFIVWMIFYTIILIGTLFICYRMQHAAIHIL